MNFVISDGNSTNIDWNEVNIKLIPKKRCLIFGSYYAKLSSSKSIIDTVNYNSEWDKMKKIANPFELIYTTYNKKKKKESIANYKPISRSFYKLWEIDNKFELLDTTKNNQKVASLAEGPGGFMEAIIKKYNDTHNVKLYGITLPPHNKYIPDWTKMKTGFSMENVNIFYGNLYNFDDIKKYLVNFKNGKCSLVTADGGFDYSSNFNGQEIDSYRIIFAEIFIALVILEVGGSFVCKFFDIMSLFTMKLVFILKSLFEEVNVYKPETSRPANSEKYLVCKGFKGISMSTHAKIITLFKQIESTEQTDEFVLDIDGIKMDNGFVQTVNNINKSYLENQTMYINKIVNLIENKNNNHSDIITKQVDNAIDWCKRNKIDINYASEFYGMKTKG